MNAGKYGLDVGDYAILRTDSHELTHFISENSTVQYKALRDFMVSKLTGFEGKSIEDLVAAKQANSKRTELSYEAALDEVIADGCEMMLKDSAAVEALARENKSLFNSVKNFIKNFVNAVKKAFQGVEANTEEAKAILRYADELQKIWDDALVQAARNYNAETEIGTNAETKIKSDGNAVFSVRTTPNGEKYIWAEEDIFAGHESQKPHIVVANYIAEHIGEAYIIIESGKKVYIGKDLPGEYTQSNYKKHLLHYNKNLLTAKNKAATVLGEMIEIATNRRWEKTEHTNNKDAKYGFYRYDSVFAFELKEKIKAYSVELVIRNASDGKKYLYDISRIKEDIGLGLNLSKRKISIGESSDIPVHTDVNNSISNNSENVNKKFSERDLEYLELAKDPEKNKDRLQAMVDETARNAGYTNDISWRIQHTAPNHKDDISILNLKESGLVPSDYWERPEWYIYSQEEKESYYKVRRAIKIAEER